MGRTKKVKEMEQMISLEGEKGFVNLD